VTANRPSLRLSVPSSNLTDSHSRCYPSFKVAGELTSALSRKRTPPENTCTPRRTKLRQARGSARILESAFREEADRAST
jgi:hypothetical protein